MRITLDGLTKEQAIDIYEWMNDKRAVLFYQQLIRTNDIIFESIIRDPHISIEASEQIKALRSIAQYIDYLRDFISEGVTGKEK